MVETWSSTYKGLGLTPSIGEKQSKMQTNKSVKSNKI